jgi:transcription antitermination factor NusG
LGPHRPEWPDSEIAALLARSDPDGVVRLPPRPPQSQRVLAPDAAVVIAGGPFAGLSGVHQGMSAPERELILLNILGREVPATIAAGLVRPQ